MGLGGLAMEEAVSFRSPHRITKSAGEFFHFRHFRHLIAFKAFYQVPISHELRYFFWTSVRESILMPMASNFRRAIS